MVAKELVACKNCSFISPKEECPGDRCPRCGGTTSKDWQGYLAVLDFEKSDIAKKMGIVANGKYALKVR